MNNTSCQFRDKHTVGGIVFYKHAFLVYINFVELRCLTLHAKFQNHRPSGSGEENFQKFLLFIAMAAILVM